MVALEAGHYERAVALLEESRTLFRELGDLRGVCMSGFILGMTELKQGNLERGTAVLEEGLPLTQRTKDKLGSAYYLMGMGGVAVEQGQPIRAARLWGAAEALRKVIGLPLSYFDLAHSGYEARLATARSQLEEATLEAAWAEGRAMSPEQAIEYALSAKKPSTTPPSSVTTQPSLSSTLEHTAGLTSREVEVLGLVATGLTSAQIAAELFLSPRTIDTHLTSIYHKLGVTSRAAATRVALEHDLA
jgi:DNA-binding CsgD family transcriptional regulator